MTFDDVVDELRIKCVRREFDDEYHELLHELMFNWEQDRADAINKAVVNYAMLKKINPGTIFILLDARNAIYSVLDSERYYAYSLSA